jgi:hypothetical protein
MNGSIAENTLRCVGSEEQGRLGTPHVMLSRGAVLRASIGRPISSIRSSFISTPIKCNRIMSSKTGFKQV